MAEEIVIGRLILDNTDVDRAMAESKKSIIDLENEQKRLKRETDNLSSATADQLKAFISNETALKRARAEYAANQKTVLEITRAQTGLDDALKKVVKTQDDAAENTKALTEARKKIDTTTVEGAKAIAEINKKIDANNKLVKENSSELERQKANVGNYPTLMAGVSGAFAESTKQIVGFAQKGKEGFGEITGALEKYKEAQAASKVATQASAAAQATSIAATQAATVAENERIAVGFRYNAGLATETELTAANTAATTANTAATVANAAATDAAAAATSASTKATKSLSIAMLAIPLVLLLALLSPLIYFLTSTQDGIDKVTAVTRPLVAIFESLIGVLQNIGRNISFDKIGKSLTSLYNYVKDKVIKQFEGLYDVFVGLVTFDTEQAKKGLKTLSDNAKSVVDDIKGAGAQTAKFFEDAIKKGQELDRLEKQLEKTRNANILLLGKANEEVKKENQIAEDVTRSYKEREAATERSIVAGREINRLKNQELDLEIAILRNKQSRNSITREDEKELNELLAKRNENNAALAELETTQVNKLNSIRKEAADKALAMQKERFDREVKEARNLIDILKAQAEQETLTTEQRIENAEKVFKLENDLAKKTLQGSDLRKAQIASRKALSDEILAITQEQIDKELEAQRKAFETIGALTQAQYDAQVQSATDLATAQLLLLDKQLLSEKAYNAAVIAINQEKLATLAASYSAFEEGEKVRQETALANQQALEEVAFQLKLIAIEDQDKVEQELKAELLAAQYERELQQLQDSLNNQTISEELYLAKRLQAEKRYALEVKKNDKALADQKRANNVKMANDAISALEGLLGESKAISIASALINTYEGITAGLKLGYPAAIPAVAFAALTGFAAVKNILKTDKGTTSVADSGSAGAGVSGSAATSGTGSFMNNAQTTTVATVSDAPTEQNTLVSPPVLVLETLAEVQNNLQIKIESA